MVSTYAYPTFELYHAVLLLAKLLLEGESLSHVWKSFPYLYQSWHLHQIKAWVRLDQVVLHYAQSEWSCVTSPGLWIIGLFQTINQSQQVHTASDTAVQLILISHYVGYPAANTSSAKDTLRRYLPGLEVHSTCNYHNFPFFSGLYFRWFGWSGWSHSLGFTHALRPQKINYSILIHPTYRSQSGRRHFIFLLVVKVRECQEQHTHTTLHCVYICTATNTSSYFVSSWPYWSSSLEE